MTLSSEQKKHTVNPKVKLVLTAGTASYTYNENDRILDALMNESSDSQKATILLTNYDQTFSSLNLEGYDGVLSYGFDIAGTPTYEDRPPLKVIAQDSYSAQGVLASQLSLVGTPDLLDLDKASDDYTLDESSTKTPKDLITEVLAATATTESLTLSQTASNANYSQSSVDPLVGQRRWIRNKYVTKLAFKLAKSGNPTGDVLFIIKSSDEQTVYSSDVGVSATALTGTATEYSVTLGTPVTIDDEVFVYCDYTGGDASNYILISYQNSDIEADENLIRLDSSWENYIGKDLWYKITYTGGGISVFDHCTAYTTTFDSEDSLIDSYTPQEAFSIRYGESRLSVVNRLLGYTGCRKRVEDDGEVHIFVPTVSGTAYNFEFSLAATAHTFYSKSVREALIVPNKETVESYPEDADQYSGTASHSASFSLLPVEHFTRAKLASTAQAAAIASAIIGNYEIEQQKGNARVPMDVLSQVYDYGIVTDDRQGDSWVGNMGYISRHYRSGGIYDMSFNFGKLPVASIPGVSPAQITLSETAMANRPVTYNALAENLEYIMGNLNGLITIVDELAKDLEWVIDSTGIATQDYAGNLAGNLIAAAQSSLISLMRSVTESNPSRSIDTVYQNDDKIRLVLVTLDVDQNDAAIVQTGSSSPPTTTKGVVTSATNGFKIPITFVVPADWYYRVATGAGSPTITEWIEWDLF